MQNKIKSLDDVILCQGFVKWTGCLTRTFHQVPGSIILPVTPSTATNCLQFFFRDLRSIFTSEISTMVTCTPTKKAHI